MHKKLFKRYTVDTIPDERRGPHSDPYASPSRQWRLPNRDDLQTRTGYHSQRKLSEESESEYRPRRRVMLNYESETENGLRRQLDLGEESDSDSPPATHIRPLYSGQRRYTLQSSGTSRYKCDVHLSGASSRLASISERSAHGVLTPTTPSLMGNPNSSVNHSGLHANGALRSLTINKPEQVNKHSLRRRREGE